MKALISVGSGLLLLFFHAQAEESLPPGVPRTVNTNGGVINVDFMFTTPEYQREAFKLVIHEANRVAIDLGLAESRPITESNVVHAFICPFGYSYTEKAVGNIKTTNYWYFVKRDYKFSDLTVANLDHRCREYREKYQWPINRLDTNAAYQLATQWLAAAHMDVTGLNRDFNVHVALNPYWNDVREIGELPKRKLTPIYIVSWLRKDKAPYSSGGGAQVELFLPTKTLLQLNVEDPKYILRSRLAFTNLSALFPGKGTITTNRPGRTIVIDGSKSPKDDSAVPMKKRERP